MNNRSRPQELGFSAPTRGLSKPQNGGIKTCFDYSTISKRIWKKRAKYAPVISITWLPFPNENGTQASLKRALATQVRKRPVAFAKRSRVVLPRRASRACDRQRAGHRIGKTSGIRVLLQGGGYSSMKGQGATTSARTPREDMPQASRARLIKRLVARRVVALRDTGLDGASRLTAGADSPDGLIKRIDVNVGADHRRVLP
jgi:hypothetical protein